LTCSRFDRFLSGDQQTLSELFHEAGMQLSLRDLTRLLGVKEQTIYRWVNDQGLPAEQINGNLWFNRAVVLEWATQRKIELPAQFLQASSTNGHTPRLSAALENGGVQFKVPGATRP